MKNKFLSFSRTSRAFFILTIFILVAAVGIFLMNLLPALAMDPTSYNCTTDSMMMQFCHDPVMTSLGWTYFIMLIGGSPFLIAWFLLGGFIVLRHIFVKMKSSKHAS